MDEKLEAFVAKLREPPRPARPLPRPRPPVPAAARLLKRRSFSLSLPAPSPRLWVNLGAGAGALAVIALGFWLALPSAPSPAPEAAVATIAPVPLPALTAASVPLPAPPIAAAKVALPIPAALPAVKSESPPPPGRAEAPPPVPPATRLAALPPPVLPPARSSEPAWLRFAVPAPPADGRPQIAIILDDVGVDRKGAERAITLPGPLTLSFMAYAEDLPRLTAAAHRAGDELMVHVPMQPLSASEDMGPNGLKVSLDRDEILRRLRWDLARFDGYVGINNHMGSRFTADAEGMTWVLDELKARGLFFLDSLTSAKSVGIPLARKLGVPHVARDVFLDDVIEPQAIAAQLAEVEAIALRKGSAIAIGHPHGPTLDVLERWIPAVKAKGFELVPVSTIVRQRTLVAGAERGGAG
jgi:polysaccharide deacetylase 2 family uncharacterized protein YibQ